MDDMEKLIVQNYKKDIAFFATLRYTEHDETDLGYSEDEEMGGAGCGSDH